MEYLGIIIKGVFLFFKAKNEKSPASGYARLEANSDMQDQAEGIGVGVGLP